MKEFFKQNKSVTSWFLIALVVGLIVWYIYRKGKQSASVEQAELPTDMPGAKLTTNDAIAVRDLSTRLFNEIDPWFNILNDQPFKELAKMSDTLFVAVYNDYNAQFYKTRKQTLAKDIAELSTLGSYGSILYGNTDLQQTLIDRFTKLNLA